MIKLRTASLTDVGNLRANNEDRFLQNDTLRLYGVADGVGGLPGGEEAAQLAVDEVAATVQEFSVKGVPNLNVAVQRANHRVAELGHQLSPGLGIGTTLTFGLVRDNILYVAHVGDSRCYVWRSGVIKQLTRDHSVESDARFRQARGEIVHYHDSNRNALTRCIGQPNPPEADSVAWPIQAGERYLFCTDGVTRLVREAELADFLGRDAPPAEIAREIVDAANRRGGPDNSTVVLIFADEVA